MNLRQRAAPTRSTSFAHAPPQQRPLPPGYKPFNIIPIHHLHPNHPSTQFPQIHAAASALRFIEDLRKPPFQTWHDNYDLLDWLGDFFGFQADNVRNTREHLVLHLSNSQMRLTPPPQNAAVLDFNLVRKFRKKLLSNYTSWCSFIGKRNKLKIKSRLLRRNSDDDRRELLYISLYLLIWGEAANLRFMPECLCYLFHHLCHELNLILDDYHDRETGQPYIPSTIGDNAFLNTVVRPLYDSIKEEVAASKGGSKPHSAWRNYDDLNEYFWSKRCFKSLKWPLDLRSNYFSSSRKAVRVGKTGYVEQRSFWNVFRSFDRVWVLLILMLQAMVIVAAEGTKYPWQAVERGDVQVKLLTVFITWAGLRLIQSILDAGMQYSLIGRETWWIGVRMVLKSMVAIAWIVVLSIFYARIWSRRSRDLESYDQIMVFLKAVFVFVVPEMLSIVSFIIPWFRNLIDGADFPLFYWLTWWFHTRIFVGRGMREGLLSNIKYSLFWVLVLVSKFLFSYFLQIKPLIEPTRVLLKMKSVSYNWHEFFNSKTNRIAVVLLWIPVIVIYLVDLQIWYSVLSSAVGAYVGLVSHLGEIRNIWQLRLRFKFFASAVQFNIMPERQLPVAGMTLVKKLRDAVKRVRLRYGLAQAYSEIESNKVEAMRFALLWNEILLSMREEDLISDQEVELMELPPNCWGIRVMRWPCVLLCNELLLSVSLAEKWEKPLDRSLWLKICKSEYRRCSIIEAYDSVKYLLLEHVVKTRSEEHSIVSRFFFEMEYYISYQYFTVFYNLKLLPEIQRKLATLIELLLRVEKDVDAVINALQTLYELCIRRFPAKERTLETLREQGLVCQNPARVARNLFENAVKLPDADDVFFIRQLRRVYTILTSTESMHNVPINQEARRRIAFFSNSLFMNIPRAPQVDKMMAFTVLTPYYDEDVIYLKRKLKSSNEDGISVLYYLQTIYEDEWQNFIERMRREGLEDEREIWTTKVRDLRIWASYRGQTLSRTVRGMMYYSRALMMLAFLDSASKQEISSGCLEIASYGSLTQSNNWNRLGSTRAAPTRSVSGASSSRNVSGAASGVSLLYKGHEFGNAMMKFSYVVACQLYGIHKIAGDSRAEEILYLMKENEALRVAYVDEKHIGRDEVEYYSVLVKYDQQFQQEVEIYRVQLPGPIKLGEGKPENQNHAIIFTRGDALQTIDMNQDNYFEEALKMRNLLEEFDKNYGIRKPTILGVREYIFTGSVSSLAWFMSSQEMSFVTLGQRVLANPLKVRMHYGHPDVFDRFWFLTRGGVSKASKLINLSEDIFAGFNCTLRGGNVTHHEYIQVGKGRDVGLNQIAMFEAKVAGGNGEQLLSRDVYRLGHRLDFFRMLSLFYTSVGHYFNTMMVVISAYTFLWGRLYLALSGVERAAMKNSSNNAALGAIVNQQFVIQLGMLTALPMIVENSLEYGFISAVGEFIKMQLQLASLFFTFSLGTRSHYFGRTILHGGAKYRSTGRGFVVQHKKFAENYRLYSRSHFVKGIELGVILVVYAFHSPLAKGTFVYIAFSISSWFLVVSWIMAPFVFNPSGFDWLKTVYDFEDFITWLWYNTGVATKADKSWETWWYEEQEHLKTTGLWGKLLEIILDLRYFFFQYAIVYQLKIASGRTSISVYLLSWVFFSVLVGIYVILAYARDRFAATQHVYYRLIQCYVTSVIVGVTIILLKFTELVVSDILVSLMAFIPTGWGILLIAQVLRPIVQTTLLWETVVSVARLYDLLFGLMVMAPVAFLSWMPGFQSMQTRMLFNDAFSRGLQISQLLTAK